MWRQQTNRHQQGFTLIEVLISITLVAFLAFLAVGLVGTSFNKIHLVNETDHLVSTLRTAQSRSVTGYQDGEWGVYLTTSSYTLYRGSDYTSRDADYDRVRLVRDGIVLSGITDVHFSSRTGVTSDVGMITLSDTASDNQKVVTINAQGRVTDL